MEKQVIKPVKRLVGDVLWMVSARDHRSNSEETTPSKVTITKVGTKFFEATNEHGRVVGKFQMNSMLQEIDSNYKKQLYLTLDEILEKREFDKLQSKLKQFFSYHTKLKMSLEKLRKVSEIVFSED